MSLLSILGAMMDEGLEPVQQRVVVQPGVNPYSGQPTGIAQGQDMRRSLGEFLTDVRRASQGRITSREANQEGVPQAAGLSRLGRDEQRRNEALPLENAKKVQDIESSKAMEGQRVATAAKSRAWIKMQESKDPDVLEAVREANEAIRTIPSMMSKANDPEFVQNLAENNYRLLKKLKTGTKPGAAAGPKKQSAAPTGKIRVKKIGTDQEGTIDASDFNEKIYKKL